MHRIRVAVVGVRELGAAILADAIAAEADLKLVDVVADPRELAPLVRRGQVDVVIAEADGAEGTAPLVALLYVWPQLRVLVLSLRGAEAVLCELRPYRVSLGNVSIAELLDAVRRTAVAPAAGSHTWAADS